MNNSSMNSIHPNIPSLSSTQVALLQGLTDGKPIKAIAESLGLSPGTARVYLCKLYRTIGVERATEAARWWIEFNGVGVSKTDGDIVVTKFDRSRLGEYALASGLHNTLGFLESYLGPYSACYEFAKRSDDIGVNDGNLANEHNVRNLWCGFIEGDFHQALRAFDAGMLKKPKGLATDSAMIALMLTIGGYSSRARKVIDALTSKTADGSDRLSKDEQEILVSFWKAAEFGRASAFEAIHTKVSSAQTVSMVFKHLTFIGLYQLYKAFGDMVRAAAVAEAIYAEAEYQKTELASVGGVMPYDEYTLPSAPTTLMRPTAIPLSVATKAMELSHYA
jgi:DNA-binding CsgD family transcriptional regulator